MLSENPVAYEIESNWIYDGEKRLNASSFSPEAVDSLNFIKDISKKMEINTVGDLVEEIFYPPRFKREYSNKGVQFLSSKDIFDFLPSGKKLKSVGENYFIKDNWILITRSGSTGRVILSNKLLSKAAITEHVIRIVPTEETPIGYLYVYLLSKIGQPLLNREIFGGVVDQIEPVHISNIPIPRSGTLEEEINQKIFKAVELRNKAQASYEKAVKTLYDELKLKSPDELDIKYLDGEKGNTIKAFILSSNELNLRLDASYHTPIVHKAIEMLFESENKGLGTLKKLKEISEYFVPKRFRRAYVKNAEDGVKLLQGSHVTQMKPQGIKYLWNKMSRLDEYFVEKNWLLVTCSGTIGKICIISDLWDGWTATNHLLRIIPDINKIHPGYLTVFLQSFYGWIQFQRLTYGGVIDEIGEAGELMDNILILTPNDKEIENLIGSLVIKAYEYRDESIKIENEAINLLERELINKQLNK